MNSSSMASSAWQQINGRGRQNYTAGQAFEPMARYLRDHAYYARRRLEEYNRQNQPPLNPQSCLENSHAIVISPTTLCSTSASGDRHASYGVEFEAEPEHREPAEPSIYRPEDTTAAFPDGQGYIYYYRPSRGRRGLPMPEEPAPEFSRAEWPWLNKDSTPTNVATDWPSWDDLGNAIGHRYTHARPDRDDYLPESDETVMPRPRPRRRNETPARNWILPEHYYYEQPEQREEHYFGDPDSYQDSSYFTRGRITGTATDVSKPGRAFAWTGYERVPTRGQQQGLVRPGLEQLGQPDPRGQYFW